MKFAQYLKKNLQGAPVLQEDNNRRHQMLEADLCKILDMLKTSPRSRFDIIMELGISDDQWDRRLKILRKRGLVEPEYREVGSKRIMVKRTGRYKLKAVLNRERTEYI